MIITISIIIIISSILSIMADTTAQPLFGPSFWVPSSRIAQPCDMVARIHHAQSPY